MGVSRSWADCKSEKLSFCSVHVLLFYMNYFPIGLWCVMNSGFYTTTRDDQIGGWSKKLQSTFQSQTCTKERSWSLFGICCLFLIHYSFLNSGETITSEKYVQQTDEMHQKLQHLQPVLVNRMGPVLLHDNAWLHVAQLTLQKVNKLGYEGLPYPPSSPDLSPVATDFNFFKLLDNFLQGNCFHSQQEAENAFQEFVYSWSTDFYTTGINQLIFHWQKCVDCNGSYFD